MIESNQSNNVPNEDWERFDKVVKLLPPEAVADFAAGLREGHYPDMYREALDDYVKYIQNPLSEFLNPTLDSAFKKFNKAFCTLIDFLINNDFSAQPEYLHEYEANWLASKDKLKELMGLADELETKYMFFRKLRKPLLTKKDEVEAKKNKNKKDDKIKIFISKRHGIYLNPTREPNYSTSGGRNRLLFCIHDNGDNNWIDGPTLSKIRSQTPSSLSRDISEINRIFKKNLHLANNLITHPGAGGYMLNQEKYKITFYQIK